MRSVFKVFVLLAASVSASASLQAEVRTTVEGRMQTRPGGPLAEVEARVEPATAGVVARAADEVELDGDELVVGLVVDGAPRAYPVRFFARNEVLNDSISGQPLVVTWCPLTGSAVAFEPRVGDRELTFDFVWGLLHDNLVLADRETGSVWSQLGGGAFGGPLEGERWTAVPLLQTTWKFWRERHPQTLVAVVPDAVERSYVYFAEGNGADALAAGEQHDLSALGLGLQVGPIDAFFSLHTLAAGEQPLRVDVAGTLVVVHHDAEGMTAWAESEDGRALTGVLVYERAWKAFHPASHVWGSGPGCAP